MLLPAEHGLHVRMSLAVPWEPLLPCQQRAKDLAACKQAGCSQGRLGQVKCPLMGSLALTCLYNLGNLTRCLEPGVWVMGHLWRFLSGEKKAHQ